MRPPLPSTYTFDASLEAKKEKENVTHLTPTIKGTLCFCRLKMIVCCFRTLYIGTFFYNETWFFRGFWLLTSWWTLYQGETCMWQRFCLWLKIAMNGRVLRIPIPLGKERKYPKGESSTCVLSKHNGPWVTKINITGAKMTDLNNQR